MTKTLSTPHPHDLLDTEDAAQRSPLSDGVPVPQPLRLYVSGLYRRSTGLLHPVGWPLSPAAHAEDFTPAPEGPALPHGLPGRPPTGRVPVPLDPRIPLPWTQVSEELRLDVDGRTPQMVVSGEVRQRLFGRCSWFAPLHARAAGGWEGDITYHQGSASLMPYSHVVVEAVAALFGAGSATATFTSSTGAGSTRRYEFASPAYHDVEMEFDVTSDSAAVTSFDTGSHPNRPATLPLETLTVQSVYARAGFKVRKSAGDSTIPVSVAGTDALWTDQEMHDAMQTYWSRFANIAQWSVWTLFAGRSIQGSGLGGIMFDSIGPNHRQGCAIFSNSFISTPPAGDPHGAAAVQRMRFWTAVHELGHTFNLAHSWQKSLGAPWLPLADEPEARSFMNYPYNVAGGPTAFFATFAHRFSDAELLYLRHAPSPFVQQGNTAWFTDHGFEQAAVSPEPELALTLRVNRIRPVFEFLEPIVVELTLENVTDRPLLVDRHALEAGDLSVIAADRHGTATALRPFAATCTRPEPVALMPGESLYASLPVSAGHGGARVADPGYYTVQACLHQADEDLVSAPLRLKVLPPHDRVAEALAPDVLEQDVRRVLAFHGSRVLEDANDTLRRVVDEMPGTAAATQAAFALLKPLATPALVLQAPTDDPADLRITSEPGDPEGLAGLVRLVSRPATAQTLGHLGLHEQVGGVVTRLAEDGHKPAAADLQSAMIAVLEPRGVKATVLEAMRARRDDLRGRSRERFDGASGVGRAHRRRLSGRRRAGAGAARAPSARRPQRQGHHRRGRAGRRSARPGGT
ncbi:MAG: uncharacterized protein JWN17_1395 [Frankiales bacterium]|nr:uncharacterized protein [Frankiales bacterium]